MLWPPEIIEKQLLLQMDGEGNNGFASTAPLRANPGTGTWQLFSKLHSSHLRLYMDSSSNRTTCLALNPFSRNAQCTWKHPEIMITFILEIIPSCRFWLWSKCAGGPQTVVLPGHQYCSPLSSDTHCCH